MKKFRLWLAAFLTAMLSVVLFAACSSGVSLNKTELSLQVGQSETLTASAPEGALLSWSSSDESVATVSGGTVTAVAEGSATITVRATVNDSAYTAQCAVTVTAADDVTVTFVADGVTVATVDVAYGTGISESDIPAVPEKDGFVGTWDMTANDLTSLTADVTVTAVYARLIDYTVTVYTQQSDLTYTAGTPQTLSAAEGTTVSFTPEAAEEGYYLDEDRSMLSATLEEGVALTVYYSLEHNTVYVRRADNTSAEYYVYADGTVATDELVIVTDYSTFALTENTEGQYYYWNIDGIVAERALTADDFASAADGAVIIERYSTDALLDTAAMYYGGTINSDGTVTFNPTSEWGTGVTAGYVYFRGSSDTFYAKYTATHGTVRSDTSVGFALVDAQDSSKSVQFYIEGYGTDRTLFQNNSWGWDGDTNRTVYSDTLAAFNADENVIEFALSDGYYYFWINGNFFYSAPISSLCGFENVEGVFDETQLFNLAICQWRFNKGTVDFSDIEFYYGSAAEEVLEEKMFSLSFDRATVNVDMSDASTLQLAVTSNWGATVDLSGVSYSTQDTGVITVDAATGAITPVGAGNATVTASLTYNGETYTATCTVVVETRTVTFTADEKPVATVTVFYGGSVSAEDVPEVPEKDGFFGEWEKTAAELTDITVNTVVTAVYSSARYIVNYYYENARTGDFELKDTTTTITEDDSVSITPEQVANYVIGEDSVLTAEIVGGTATLEVYYELVVSSVSVSIDLGEGAQQYTAYYAIGLYQGEAPVSDYSVFEQSGYIWMINNEMSGVTLNQAYFSALTEDVIATRHNGSMTFSSASGDMANATVNDDGSVNTESSGWTGAWTYFTGSGTTFYAQTTVRSRNQMEGGDVDTDISAGFTVRGSDGTAFSFYLSFRDNCIRLNYGHEWGNGEGNFGETESPVGSYMIWTTLPSDNFSAGEGAVVGLAYSEGSFRIYVDGVQVYELQESALQFAQGTVTMGEGWSVGLASWDNHRVNFSDFFVVYGETEAINEDALTFEFTSSSVHVDVSDPATMQLGVTTNWFAALAAGTLTYSTEDTHVLTVDSSTGVITPVGAGNATVTATLAFGGKTYTATCTVVVESFTVSFVADSDTVETIVVFYGGSVSAAEIPEVPPKDGYGCHWDTEAEDLVRITDNVTVTAIYYDNQYTVNYYYENALTGEYDLEDTQSAYTPDTQITISPTASANYTINAEKSVLSGTIVDKQLTLNVYFDLVVSSVTVSVDLGEGAQQYTAYYGLGLYQDSAEVDYGMFAQDGYVWKVNDGSFVTSLDRTFFLTLLEDVSLLRCVAVTEVNTSDMSGATVNDDGSVSTVSSGWTGAYAYLNGSGTNFYMEATITAPQTGSDPVAYDVDLTSGFTVKGADGASFQIYLSYNTIRINTAHQFGGTAGEGNLTSAVFYTNPGGNFVDVAGTPVTLGLGYADGTFYVYVNGTLIYSFTTQTLAEQLAYVPSMGEGWTVGFASWDTRNPTFSDFYVVFGEFEAPVTE